MRVTLMAHIKNNRVFGAVEYTVKSKGQLHYAEVARQVSAVLRHRLDDTLSDFGTQVVKLFF